MQPAPYSLFGDGPEVELRFHGVATGAILDDALQHAFKSSAKCVVVEIAMDDSDFVSLAKQRRAEFLPIQCGLAEVRFRAPRS